MIKLLPYFNVFCNILATLCLLTGGIAIKLDKKDSKNIHKKAMKLAMLCSSFFLTSYLIYHYYTGHQVYPGVGWMKTLYFFILVPHILLAAILLPLVFRTFYLAITKQYSKHQKWAKWTYPIWLYVSISGVAIFYMIYPLPLSSK